MQKNCYEIAPAIFNRLIKSAQDLKLHYNNFTYTDLKLFESVYKINCQFGKKITAEDLQNIAKKEELLEHLIYDLVEQFQDGQIEIVDCIKTCVTIANILSENQDRILLKFCSKVESFNAILQSAELIYEASCNSQNLCLVSVLILKYIGSSMHNLHQTALDLNETLMIQNTSLDINNFIKGLKLAEKIATKAILSSEVSNLDCCVEVLKWIQTTCFMTVDRNDVSLKDVGKCSFVYDVALPANMAFQTVKRVFNLYVNHASK